MWKVSGDDVLLKSAAEQDATNLDIEKGLKFAAIDQKTISLLSTGVEYPPSSGAYFNLDKAGLAIIADLYLESMHPSASYPKMISSSDGLVSVTLDDAVAAKAFWLAANTLVRSAKDAGEALKDTVRKKSTVAEVQAVVDNR
jgi:hypothetical protein